MSKTKMCSFIQDMELEEDDYDIESMLIFDPDDQVKDKVCHKHLLRSQARGIFWRRRKNYIIYF